MQAQFSGIPLSKLKSRWFFLLIALTPLSIFGVCYWWQTRVAALPYFSLGFKQQTDAPYYQVPGFAFINQQGLQTDSSFVKGKVWVADFFFTSCPTICPKMTRNLQKIQAAYKNDSGLTITSTTVDPVHDQPARLKAYAAKNRINTGQWQLLTGTKVNLYRYARKALGVVATDGDGGPGDFIHSDQLVLIDQKGHIRGYYDGTSNSATQALIKDIERLLQNN
ncbi:protein SCO1/2 [Arachidicoccus rhizosphaerae]|uniref:Protein SCO1/2 n=1 Tax=Arachidicoccus rhizosphaerae TaxID=551991 RepID=A0A1H4BJG8_9BACT|nr:SCO family protein [Arachidicoccus rhizosphaerae]SEA48303.1 protein SCO1/2 [Arachidicoccus rhizosphaerae]